MGLEKENTIVVPKQSYDCVGGRWFYILSCKAKEHAYKTSVYECDEDGCILNFLPIYSISYTSIKDMARVHNDIRAHIGEIARGVDYDVVTTK